MQMEKNAKFKDSLSLLLVKGGEIGVSREIFTGGKKNWDLLFSQGGERP